MQRRAAARGGARGHRWRARTSAGADRHERRDARRARRAQAVSARAGVSASARAAHDAQGQTRRPGAVRGVHERDQADAGRISRQRRARRGARWHRRARTHGRRLHRRHDRSLRDSRASPTVRSGGAHMMLSQPMPKPIATRERLIFALDVPEVAAARGLVERLGDAVQFYKIGLELFMSGHYFELLDWLAARDKKIFVDLKFFDIPATVAAAVRTLQNRGVTFTTVHGNQSIMQAAAAAKGDVKVLAVTLLTSLDRGDLDDMGFQCEVEQLVLSRARRALEAGCDGVVSSALEVPRSE